ncbi:MAG TPA: hypothetical protein VGS22_01430 [Thermoanaerobaculia bacterium]|jgi:hypothetical protein|nr:hypothetical protein [Thermoanaerobaculia bacterium]
MKRPTLIGILVLAALAAVTPPLEAGESFVPIARNQPSGTGTLRTVVFVSNLSTTAKTFITQFLIAGTDGVTNPGESTTLSVGAGQSVRLDSSVPVGSRGMLRIDGPSDLQIDARLITADALGTILSEARVPVLSPERVTPAGETLYLQALERRSDGKPLTDFGIANLTREAASCTVAAVRSNGQSIGSAATFSLFPLSLRDFPEVWVTLGTPEIADARITVSCNKQFSAFALVYDVGGPRTAAMTPGGALDGTLEPISRPGEVVFNAPGDFLIAKSSDSYRSYAIPLVPNLVYQKATIDFDMFLNKFPNGFYTSVTSFRRTHRDRHQRRLYYGVQIRNDNKKTNLDLGDEVLVRSGAGVWKKGTQYHLKFEYDLTVNRVTLTVTKDGQRVFSVDGPPQTPELVDNGNAISVDFGQTGIADGAYFPPIGWVYSNLQVKFEPKEN